MPCLLHKQEKGVQMSQVTSEGQVAVVADVFVRDTPLAVTVWRGLCVFVLVLSQLYSFSHPFCKPLCSPFAGRRFQHISSYDVAEWLDRERKMKTWTTVQWTNKKGPRRTSEKKKKTPGSDVVACC